MNYIIETERLKLRELTLDDTEKLALVLSDPQSMRFYPHPFSREVKQIISYMKSDNLPSRHVAERNGMTFVKSFTKIVMGKVVEDEVLYMKDLISE